MLDARMIDKPREFFGAPIIGQRATWLSSEVQAPSSNSDPACVVPSGYVKTVNWKMDENGPVEIVSPLEMVIFHSYIKLPEGILREDGDFCLKI